MTIRASIGNPFLILIYSASLLLVGSAIGIFWRTMPVRAFSIAAAGGILMVIHDTLMGFFWFFTVVKLIKPSGSPAQTSLKGRGRL